MPTFVLPAGGLQGRPKHLWMVTPSSLMGICGQELVIAWLPVQLARV